MNRLQIKIQAALMSKGLRQGDLARAMSIEASSLSQIFKRNMKMDTALLINDSLYLLTGECLTLEDFRKDKND